MVHCPNPGITERKRGIEICKKMDTQPNHPKAGREKLNPKNRLTSEKTTLPKGLLSKNLKTSENSDRVVMQQFINIEKYAPSPPRKLANRQQPRQEPFNTSAKHRITQASENRTSLSTTKMISAVR
jgi:hypothetical protein